MTGAILVYDDDCGFCTWWANWIEARSDVPLVGFSELEDGSGTYDDLRARLPDDYEDCAHLVTDGAVYSCGASIEEALVRAGPAGPLVEPIRFLRHFRDYNRLRESTYRWVAEHRGLLGHVFRAEPPARAGDDGEDDEADDD